MALHRSIYPVILRGLYRTSFHLQKNLKQSTPKKNSTVDFGDVMDIFTIELLQKKKEGWDIKNEKLKPIKLPIKNDQFNSKLDITNLSKAQLDEVFNCSLLECNDTVIISLLQDCLMLRIYPSNDFILPVLNICAQNGEVDLINDFKRLCIRDNINLPSNWSFDIYQAQAVWVKGLVIKGLDMFQEIYRRNPFQRRYIRVTLRQLISREVKNNSEAVLVYMLKVSKKLIKEHGDYFFLAIIWESCYMSELYSDQQLALELLSEDKKLIEFVSNRLPFLVSSSLKSHKTESVYKLLECFHIMNMKQQCTIVAMAFLDYHFLQGNVGNYSEIIKWCKNCDVPLPSVYDEKFLNLLLKTDAKMTGKKAKPINKNKNTDLLF